MKVTSAHEVMQAELQDLQDRRSDLKLYSALDRENHHRSLSKRENQEQGTIEKSPVLRRGQFGIERHTNGGEQVRCLHPKQWDCPPSAQAPGLWEK